MKDDQTGSAIAAIFSPRSVAVIGASSNPTKLGGRPVAFLKDYGFKGDIYPVNAGQAEVQGLVSYKDVRDIPGPVDQAVIVVPSQHVEEALRGCAEKGVKVAQVLSSGFAEADEAVVRRPVALQHGEQVDVALVEFHQDLQPVDVRGRAAATPFGAAFAPPVVPSIAPWIVEAGTGG